MTDGTGQEVQDRQTLELENTEYDYGHDVPRNEDEEI